MDSKISKSAVYTFRGPECSLWRWLNVHSLAYGDVLIELSTTCHPPLSCFVLNSPFFSRCSFSHWRHVCCPDCPQVVVPPVCSCRYASSRLDFTLLFSNYFFLLPCCMRELIMSRRKYKSLLASRPRYCKSREVRVTVIRLWMFFCRSKWRME